MRAVCRARWVTCALAISFCVPAAAARRARSLAACVTFAQADRGEARVAFTIHNACTRAADCVVGWRVVCAPDARKRRAAYPSAARFAIGAGTSRDAEASAEICGDDAWVIDRVTWRCEPSDAEAASAWRLDAVRSSASRMPPISEGG